MAVAPTGDIYKALSFDNVSSRTYGVYITGSAVYNAPEREVEMISIPGRNGQFALDKGRFENIEVTYPTGLFADNETDFAEAISEFRNFLCSRKGYVRLQDEYNPNEYRMAIYKSGLEVEPAQLKAGEFEITFDCKPQRFLTSGETAVTVSSGDTLTNPTLFEASPLIETQGWGLIEINDYSIRLTDETVGEIELLPAGVNGTRAGTGQRNFYILRPFDKVSFALVNNGDTITLPNFAVGIAFQVASNQTLNSLSFTFSGSHGISNYKSISAANQIDERTIERTISYGAQTWQKSSGTLSAEDTVNVSYQVTTTNSDDTTTTETKTTSFKLKIELLSSGAFSVRLYDFPNTSGSYVTKILEVSRDAITAVSTQSVLGTPTYIDCELGEAYKIVSGNFISLNRYIELGSDLPVLTPGENEIVLYNNYGSTYSFKITPRWWKV